MNIAYQNLVSNAADFLPEITKENKNFIIIPTSHIHPECQLNYILPVKFNNTLHPHTHPNPTDIFAETPLNHDTNNNQLSIIPNSNSTAIIFIPTNIYNNPTDIIINNNIFSSLIHQNVIPTVDANQVAIITQKISKRKRQPKLVQPSVITPFMKKVKKLKLPLISRRPKQNRYQACKEKCNSLVVIH